MQLGSGTGSYNREGGGSGSRQTLTVAAYGHCEAFVVHFLPSLPCCLLPVAVLQVLVVVALRELSNLSQVEF